MRRLVIQWEWSATAWSYGASLPVAPENMSTCKALVGKMIDGRAFCDHRDSPPSQVYVLLPEDPHADRELQCLRALQQHGLVICSEDMEDRTLWYLSQNFLLKMDVDVALVLQNPRYALEPRLDIAKSSWSAYELVAYLAELGWQLQVAPHGRGAAAAKQALLPYNLHNGSGRSNLKTHIYPSKAAIVSMNIKSACDIS